MRSRVTARFRAAFSQLPRQTQDRARKAYRLFRDSPKHPSLRFKRVHPIEPVYSVRISLDCRALGIAAGEEIIWFWIGSHEDYDKLLR